MDRIVIPTGYMGSGSSAITDLVSEFRDFKNEYKSYEYVMLHCPNGLFDLEDKLLYGNNAIRSDEAIRTFEQQMKKLYDKKFWWVGNYKKIIGPAFMNIVNNYVDEITQIKYQGYWYTHEEVNASMFCKLIMRRPLKVIQPKRQFNPVLKYKDGMKISFINPEEFYKYSKSFINRIIEEIAGEAKNIVLDQFVLPFNLHRVDKYFDDNVKVIVVERDPRDVFLLNKYIWPKINFTVPMPHDAELFVKYYKAMRNSEKPSQSSKVLRINFEDLVYNYEDTLGKVMKHLGVNSQMHIDKKKRFNPELSIKNTQIFNSSPQYEEEIKIIENGLSEFLYKFPYKINDNKVENTIEF